jgi:hypothetical protein
MLRDRVATVRDLETALGTIGGVQVLFRTLFPTPPPHCTDPSHASAKECIDRPPSGRFASDSIGSGEIRTNWTAPASPGRFLHYGPAALIRFPPKAGEPQGRACVLHVEVRVSPSALSTASPPAASVAP